MTCVESSAAVSVCGMTVRSVSNNRDATDMANSQAEPLRLPALDAPDVCNRRNVRCPGNVCFGSKAVVIDVAEIVVSLDYLRFNLRVVWLQRELADTARC